MLRVIWVMLLFVLLASRQVLAADIERLDGHPEGCTHMLSGVIQIGDTDAMEAVIDDISAYDGYDDGLKICFDSVGGNWEEGVNIALALYDSQISSHIPENGVCLSACAIAFLGGSTFAEEGSSQRSRSMHSTATLGFHAVSLNVDDGYKYEASEVERAFIIALDAVSLIYSNIERLRVDASFVNRFMQIHGENQFLYIDTVGAAQDLGVTITGVSSEVRELQRSDLRRMCFETFPFFSDGMFLGGEGQFFVSNIYYFTVQAEDVSGYYNGIFIASSEEGNEALSLCFYRRNDIGYTLHRLSLGILGAYNRQSYAAQDIVGQIDRGVDASYLIGELLSEIPSYFGSTVAMQFVGASAQYDPSTPLSNISGEGALDMN